MAQLIAGVEQVLQVLNHRQARANVSVIEELTPRTAGRMAQLVIVIQRRGIGLLFGVTTWKPSRRKSAY